MGDYVHHRFVQAALARRSLELGVLVVELDVGVVSRGGDGGPVMGRHRIYGESPDELRPGAEEGAGALAVGNLAVDGEDDGHPAALQTVELDEEQLLHHLVDGRVQDSHLRGRAGREQLSHLGVEAGLHYWDAGIVQDY